MPTEADRPGPDFLTIREAAEYVGTSPQTLRRWDAAGKLKPVRHPGNRYRFYSRADLEPFRLEYQHAQASEPAAMDLFTGARGRILNNDRLREPQKEAYRHVRDFFRKQGGHAVVQLPVGCGKTGEISILPFGIASGRVLVIAPNLTIREELEANLDIRSPKCFWSKTRVLSDFSEGPFCAVLDGKDANIHDCIESHFVLANIQQLASSADRWLPQFPPSFFDMIIVDEGHHNVAESWRKVFDRFSGAKVVSLTATPFRSDGQELEGELIYRYPYAAAMLEGYIKQIHSENVAPSEIYFTYAGDDRRHSLEEVYELREEAWFRRGVALSAECNRHIVEASVARCLALREASTLKHQIIAATCSVDHARAVRALYEECGMEAREIHSDMLPEKRERVLADLKSGRLDCIVQVQMLGEGFDHPPLSVAAVFRPYRSLSAYVQFVGRIMRVNHQDDPEHVDNHGWVVSHVGLNTDAHWNDFQEFDLEDQQVFRDWLTKIGGVAEPGDAGEGEGKPRRFDLGMRVDDEIISHFIQQSFLDPDDDRVIEMILNQKVPGTPLKLRDVIDAEQLREKIRAQQREMHREPQTIPVPPQARRRSARARLNERSRSVAARVLSDLGLSPAGREISRALGQRPCGNRQMLYSQIHNAVNERLGIASGRRGQLTAQQCEEAFDKLDELGDEVRDAIGKSLRRNR